MKTKAFAGIVFTVVLMVTLFHAIPIQATPDTIKVGVIGPMPWVQGQGMKEGATMAMELINSMGGVNVSGTFYDIELVVADTLRGMPDPNSATGAAAMLEVLEAGADFVQGGFRTEAVFGAVEVAMDYGKIYTITGAATTELLEPRVGEDYARYKYLFRVTPPNSSILLKTLAAFYNMELLGYRIDVNPFATIWGTAEPALYKDNDLSNNVTVEDERIYPVNKTGAFLDAGYVASGEADIGDPIAKINPFATIWGTAKPALYKDNDLSRTVTAGDERIFPVNKTGAFLSGVVAGGDADIGDPLWLALDAPGILTRIFNDPVSPTPKLVGPATKVAAIVEAAVWADLMYNLLTVPDLPNAPLPLKMGLGYRYLLGPYADVVYSARPSPVATTFDAEIAGIMASDARLVVQIFSAEAGLAYIIQQAAAGVNAVTMGIDVLAQEGEHWPRTGGAAEYEGSLSTSMREPFVPAGDDGWGRFGNIGTIAFWDAYIARWGHEPIYTSWGAYDALIGAAESIERTGTFDPDANPGPSKFGWTPDAGVLIRTIENMTRTGTQSTFKFTAYHDVYVGEYKDTWTEIGTTGTGWSRVTLYQWQMDLQTGQPRKVPVFPHLGLAAKYTGKYKIPPTMYELAETDLSIDGTINPSDMAYVTLAWLTEAGDPLWNRKADMDMNGLIDVRDASRLARDWGKSVSLPLP